jgi:hypothetical protein
MCGGKYGIIRAGYAPGLSSAVEKITRKKLISFARFATDCQRPLNGINVISTNHSLT